MLAFIPFFFASCNTVTSPAAYYSVDYKNFYQLPEVNQKINWDEGEHKNLFLSITHTKSHLLNEEILFRQ